MQTIAIYLAMGTGSVVLIGTVLILMFRKTYVDAQTKEPIEFELPLLGKIKTQSPLVAIAILGTGLLLYGVYKSEQDMLSVTGKIESDQPVTVYFVGFPNGNYHDDGNGNGDVSTRLPLIPGITYHAKYVVGKEVVDDKELTINGKEANMMLFRPPPKKGTPLGEEAPIKTRIEVTDEQAQRFLTGK